MTEYANRKYQTIVNLTLTWANNKTFDAMDGLNEGHAMWRAKQNWPDAIITLRYAASRINPALPT